MLFHKGINIGGWLSQYEFLTEQPNVHFSTFITEKDIKQIKDWGFDHIRLPVSGYLLYDRERKELNPVPLSFIDQCIDWCKKYQLNLILDLHDLWGNVYGAMDTPMPLLTDENLKNNFFTIWEKMADYYKNVTGITIMFELLNEVSDASGHLWNSLYKEAVLRIRAIDQNRLILIGSNCQNSVFYLNQLELINDPNVYYNFHYYDPQVFTHQKAHFSEEMVEFNQTVTYPGDISAFAEYLKAHPKYQLKYALVADETSNDRALMDKLLGHALAFIHDSSCQLYCGEFGVIDSAPPNEAAKWINDFLEILDANGIGHSLWNYKSLDFGLLNLQGNVVSEYLLDFIRKNNLSN